ncbi:unnamed protein product [Ambrosiozyma monospora]|uniref:Unnamed protein product n=1 Tax=Ambrosiozyma monospora TaxID=43982 RepID=A0ACB5SVF7_AMBMO|nr:unnamed protein product [Ambrosiozyma monospora]
MSDSKESPSVANTEDLSIKELWRLLENWFKNNWTEAYESLNPSITSEELEEFETAVKSKLPEDYRESLLIHNGNKWIPFAADGSGYNYCLDLDPTAEGSMGQVITMADDNFERNLLGTSFKDYFGKFVKDVYDGKYSREYGGLCKKKE